jgi:hypothetical protein
VGVWGRFLAWMFKPATISPDKGHPDLYPIDAERLVAELRLREDARRLGEAGLPPDSSRTLSGPESAVVQRIEKARQDYVDWATLRLSILTKDIAGSDLTERVLHSQQMDKEFERAADALLADTESTLRSLRNTVDQRNKELATFRQVHQLEREAFYPSPGGRYLLLSVLAFLILIEGAINAALFARGLDGGLIAGFAYAGIAAALNVMVQFLIGLWLLRFLFHSSWFGRIFGLTVGIAAAVLLLMTALGVAHYREALMADTAQASRVAIETLTAHPFSGLRDGWSWPLFIVTVVFGLAALADGLKYDDLHPGYGSLHRRTLEAAEEYEEELRELREDLEKLKDDHLEQLESALKSTRSHAARLEGLIEDKWTAGKRLTNAWHDADNSLARLLQTFRTENQLHRHGHPSPSYFEDAPPPSAIPVPSFDTSADIRRLAELTALVSKFVGDAQLLRGNIQAAFNAQYDRLRPLETHFEKAGD